MTPNRRKRRWLRYSLRSLLLLTLALSIWLGWMANQAANQRRAVALVEELGGQAGYECTMGPPSRFTIKDDGSLDWECPSEGFFFDLFGHDWFHDVSMVALTRADVTDEQVGEIVKGMPSIRYLHVYNCPSVTDTALEDIASLSHLENVFLIGTGVTVDGVKRLKRQMPDLVVFMHEGDAFDLEAPE